MATYIYLNKYRDGSLYVGSHTWGGPEGMLDPDYHGSSRIAERFHLELLEEVILEQVSEDRRFVAETEWIEKYCNLYGVSPLVWDIYGSDWTSRFKVGVMINCHSNNAAHLLTDEGRRISVEGRIRKGYKKGAIKAAQTRLASGHYCTYHNYRASLEDKSQVFNTLQELCDWCEELTGKRFIRVTISQLLKKGDVFYKGVKISYAEGKIHHKNRKGNSKETSEKIRDILVKAGHYKRIMSLINEQSRRPEVRKKASETRQRNEKWVEGCKARFANLSEESKLKAKRTRLLKSQLYLEITTGFVGPCSRLRSISSSLEYAVHNHFKDSDDNFKYGAWEVHKIPKEFNKNYLDKL